MARYLKTGVFILSLILFTLFSSTYCHADEQDFIFSETEDSIYNTLRAAGYSRAGACGILGNMAVENPQFTADLYGNGGITYGLFQWNNVGERMDNLAKWCEHRKLDSDRVEGQLAFAMHELEGGDPIARRAEEFLKTTDNPRNAAMEFAVGFERCIGSTSVPEIDAEYDGFIYPERFGRTYQAMGKRMDMAEKYFDGYLEGYSNPSLIYKIDTVPTPGIVSEIEDKMHIDIQRSLNFEVDARRAEEKGSVPLLRALCVLIGYFFGCIYFVMFVIDKETYKKSRMTNAKEIPHARTVLAYFGVGKATFIFLGDILKVLMAATLTTLVIKGLPHDESVLYTGLGVVIGNAYPFWNKFRGGIGLTVTVVVLIFYMPIWGALCCVIGLFFATILQSLTVGVVIMSFTMIPFTFHYKTVSAGIIVTVVLLLLIISHQRILLRYFDRKVLRAHYVNRRTKIRARAS